MAFRRPVFLGPSISLMVSAVLGPQLLALIPISLAVIGIWAAVPVFWSVPGRHLTGVAVAAGMAMINIRRQPGRLRWAVHRRLAARVERQLYNGVGDPGVRSAAGRTTGAAAAEIGRSVKSIGRDGLDKRE